MNGAVIPSGGVLPGTRAPWGPSGRPVPGPWNEFAPSDLEVCYPRPAWFDAHLRNNPQRSVGDGLHDPLPVPFTAEEVRAALLDIYTNRKAAPDRVTPHCARVSPLSVHIALTVLPTLERRNGGWIDYDAGRPLAEPPSSRNATPRAGVFNLRCLLYRLPGKPIGLLHQGPCLRVQPNSVATLLNVRDISTTYSTLVSHPPHISPIPPVPRQGYEAPPWPFEAHPPAPPVAPAEVQAENEVLMPQPFTYDLFEIYETFDIRS